MQTITRAYILGIKEGRSLLKAYPDIDKQSALDTARKLARQHSGDMKDMFRGEADFWKNQLKK